MGHTEGMKPPNWFLSIVAFCLVMLTIMAFVSTARASHEWYREDDGDIFDRKTGTWCFHDPSDKVSPRVICADLTNGKRVTVH